MYLSVYWKQPAWRPLSLRDLYKVMVNWTEFTVTIRAERLTRWETEWKVLTSSKKNIGGSFMTLTVNKCAELKSKLLLKCFIFLKICHLLCVYQTLYKLCHLSVYWSRSMTFKYDSWLQWISLLILTYLLRLKWIFIFELIYSNKIFISSHKNHHYFLQFNEIKMTYLSCFLLFSVLFK